MAGNEYDPAAEINFDTLHLESLSYIVWHHQSRKQIRKSQIIFHCLLIKVSDVQSFQTDDERPTFRPFTRESLAKIEARIQEHNAKTKDLEKKRAEGEVRFTNNF